MANPNNRKYDYLLAQNEKYMNLTALTFGDRTITYEELHDRIQKYAKMLYQKGIRENDVIGVCTLNTPESVYLLYALDMIGAIVVGYSPFDSKERIKQDIAMTNPKMVISVDMNYSNFKESEKALNFSTILYSPLMSSDDLKLKVGYQLLQLKNGNFTLSRDKKLGHLLKQNTDDVIVPKASFEKETLTDILFTGGSTGVHKGVELSGEGINHVVEGMRYMYDYDWTGKTYLGNIPFGHMVYGRVIMHIALTNNMTYALTVKALPSDFYSELVRTKANCAVGGPPHWTSLIEKRGDEFVPRSDLKKGSLANLDLATSGGEAKKTSTDDAINQALKYCGSKTVLGDGLGATEAWSVITLNSGKCYTPGTIGSPISTIKMKLVDPVTQKEIKGDQPGLLYISGPSVMLGYHQNEEETAKVISYDEDGTKWCNLGDYLQKVGPNTYKYVGRLKRNFVSGIENIYPEELEELISTFKEVKEVVVTPIPDDIVQYVPRYHISLYDKNIDYTSFEERLKALITTKLSPNWLPCDITYYDEPLKRMMNSKLDIAYYQEKDKQDLKEGKLRLEESKKVRLKNM